MFGQCSSHGARLLRAQIFRLVATTLVELSEVLLLSLVNNGQDSGDRLADSTAGNKHDSGEGNYRESYIVICTNQIKQFF